MMRRMITSRTDRVVRAHRLAAFDAEVVRLAAHLGIPESELRAEVEEVDHICRVAGAFTVEARVIAVAKDLGLPADEVRIEAERLRAAVAHAAG